MSVDPRPQGTRSSRAAVAAPPSSAGVRSHARVGDTLSSLQDARRELAFSRAPIALSISEVADGRYIDVNEAYCRLLGFAREELVGRTSIEVGVWARPEERAGIVRELSRAGRLRDHEIAGFTRTGQAVTVLMDADVVDVGGRACLLTSLRDVTEQRRAEQALRASEEKFARAFRASPDAVTITRIRDAVFVDVNEGFVAMTGFSRDEAVGRSAVALDLWADAEARAEIVRELQATGHVRNLERPFRMKDGSLRFCSLSAELVEIAGEPCMVAVTRDLSERHAAEAALRESEERYRLVTERTGQLIYDLDLATGVNIWAGAVERLTGCSRDEFAGVDASGWRCLIHPEDLARVDAAVAGAPAAGDTYRVRYRLRRRDGGVATVEESGFFILDAAGAVVRRLGIIDDVTERVRLEGELLQSQRMETVGRLAGGVAHDFNNLLTVILGHLALLENDTGLPADCQRSLHETRRAAEMAADLTRQLLQASRQQPLQRGPLDVREVVEGMASLLGRTLGEDVQVVVSNEPGQPPVHADRGSIEQVLLNLCVNARDAMARGGRLEIATAAENVGEDYVRSHPEARAGAFVRVTVSDTGGGIAPELMPRIFEPFFTTKPAGHGTGLGLASVYGIVRQHGGWVEVRSEVGRGSAFSLLLPVAREAPAAPARAQAPAAGPAGGSGQTVFLVEDEAPVRRLVELILTRSGYRVITAASGRAALQLWEAERPAFDVLVTDVVMPERVSGRELADRMRAQGVRVPVVFMSGYKAGALGEVSAGDDEWFIAKPFGVQAFLEIVATALKQAARR